jgi:HprK-related kinase A
LIVGDLPQKTLAQRLAGPGLRLRTGPVLTEIQSPFPAVLDGIALFYAEHPAEEHGAFVDFHVTLSRRCWLKSQVLFQFDGRPPFHPLPADQAFPVLEWGLNWCVSTHCHQYLMVHAAVVERSGGALLLPGPPGSGKSTLCAGLVSRGWRLLSDELMLLDPASGYIVPLPRPISLKNGAIELIRHFAPGAVLGPIVRDTLKGSVAHLKPPPESVRRAHEGARPRWVAFPRYETGASAHPRHLPRGSAFMRLADCAFNYHLYGERGFELLGNVIQGCTCYELAYGDLEEAVTGCEALAACG